MTATRPCPELREHIELRDVPIPALLFRLVLERFTGLFTVAQAGQSRSVWFRGGLAVYTDWQHAGTRLGDLAIAHGMASREMVDRAVARPGPNKKIGAALVEQGVFPAASLPPLLRSQCARRLVELFALREGIVVLTPEPIDVDLLQVNMLEVVQQGVARHYDVGRIRAEMGEHWSQLLVATPSLSRYLEQFRFSEIDGEFVLPFGIGAGSRLDQLCEQLGAEATRAAQVAYTLWSCQMLEPKTTGNGVSSAWEDELARVEVELARNADPFTLLCLDNEADADGIEAAYKRLTNALTGEPLTDGVDDGLLERQSAVLAALTEVRLQARQRRQAIAELAGVRLVREGKFARAQRLLDEAETLGSLGGEAEIARSWCKFNMSKYSRVDLQLVDSSLERLVDANPDIADGHYYLGMILLSMGKPDGAVAEFERTLALDSGRTDAARQLRALRRDSTASVSRADSRAVASRPRQQSRAHTIQGRTDPGASLSGGHELLTLGWRRIYWIAAALFALLAAINLILRLDRDF